MFRYLRIPAALVLAAMLSLSACGGNNSDKSGETETMQDSVKTAASYYCPMKCEGEKTYPEAGSCPVCGMDLVATDDVMHNNSHESNDHMHDSNDDMHNSNDHTHESNDDMHK